MKFLITTLSIPLRVAFQNGLYPEHISFCFYNGVFDKLLIGKKELIRIKPPFTLTLCATITNELLKGITNDYESGGLIGFKHVYHNNTYNYCAERIDFIKNTALRPQCSYKCSSKRLSILTKEYFDNNLYPFEFHSHPINDTFENIYQMGASPNDQQLSIPIKKITCYNFTLLQIIFIKNSIYPDSLFVGVYGGFIAPANFEQSIFMAGSKNVIKLMNILVDFIKDKAKDPANKFNLYFIGLFTTGLALASPKTTFSFLINFGYIALKYLPAIESIKGEIYEYFGIATRNKDLSIVIPEFMLTPDKLEQLKNTKYKNLR